MEWTKWLTIWWYKYLLEPKSYLSDSWRETILCRIKGHPCGSIYYNPGGLEPDERCKNCGDELC